MNTVAMKPGTQPRRYQPHIKRYAALSADHQGNP